MRRSNMGLVVLFSCIAACAAGVLCYPNVGAQGGPGRHFLASGHVPEVLAGWHRMRGTTAGVGTRELQPNVPFVVDVPKVNAEVRGTAELADVGTPVEVSTEVRRIDNLEDANPVTRVQVVIFDAECNSERTFTNDWGPVTDYSIPGSTSHIQYPISPTQSDQGGDEDDRGSSIFLQGFSFGWNLWGLGEGNEWDYHGSSHWSTGYKVVHVQDMDASTAQPDNDGFTVFSTVVDTGSPTSTGQPWGRQDYYIGIYVEADADGDGNGAADFVFDNLTGFTLRPWSRQYDILVVHDFTCGQHCKYWLAPVRGVSNPLEESSYAHAGMPVESYFGYPGTGRYGSRNRADPAGRVGEGSTHTITGLSDFGFPDWNTWEPGYDKWRIASRGRILPGVMHEYLPANHAPGDEGYGSIDPEYPIWSVLVDAQGFATAPNRDGDKPDEPLGNLYVADRCAFWFAPYTGNLLLGKESGTISDAQTQADLTSFVNQGGRILVSGQDIGWALTLNGSIGTPAFYTNILGATFVRDDVGGNPNNSLNNDGASLASAGSGFANNPVVYGPRSNWHGDNGVCGDVQPTSLHFGWTNTSNNTTWHREGAMQQAWPDVISTAGGANPVYTYSAGGTAGVYRTGFGRGGRTVYLSFGLEAVHRGFYYSDTCGIRSDNFRHKIVSNTSNWMRTASIRGLVTAGPASADYPPGMPIADALVVARSLSGGLSYGTFTTSKGYYQFRGLPVDQYSMTAQIRGHLGDHQAGVTTWGKGFHPQEEPAPGWASYDETFVAREDFNLLPAPPGAVDGYVYSSIDLDGDATNDPDPVPGITVRATSRTGDPAWVGEGTTDATGHYLIRNVPVDTYDVEANPDEELNFSSDSQEDVNVQSGQTVRVDFTLDPSPGNLQGTVTDQATTDPIQGAEVEIQGIVRADGSAYSGTTDAEGRYRIDDIPAGARTANAGAPGYLESTGQATVPRNGTATLNFALEAVPDGTVSGQVTDSTGTNGIAGITVQGLFANVVKGEATTDAQGNYELSLPAARYTIKAVHPTGDYAFSPEAGTTVTIVSDETVSDIDFRAVAQTSLRAGLHIIGPAYDYLDKAPPAVFGRDAAAFKMARWVPAAGAYSIYSPGTTDAAVSRLLRGRGYFVSFPTAAEVLAVGTPTDSQARRAPVEVPLSSANGGWNLIGDPYDWDIDFSLSTVRVGGQVISMQEAAAQGVLSPVLFAYDNGYVETSVLREWRGGWVQARQDVDLILSSEPVLTRQVEARERSGVRAGLDWQLRLNAQAEGLQDAATWLGASGTATGGFDGGKDVPKPPTAKGMGGAELSVYFPHTDYGVESGRYASDVRGKVRTSETWDVVVQTRGSSQAVTLTWPDLRNLPRYYGAVLVDQDSGEQINMRTTSSYSFEPGETGLRSLSVTVRMADAANALVVLGASKARGNASVTYRTLNDATVDVKVLNAAGRIIRHLVNDDTRVAGTHTESWNGRDDNGTAVPPGFYSIEIRGVFADQTITRATTRVRW